MTPRSLVAAQKSKTFYAVMDATVAVVASAVKVNVAAIHVNQDAVAIAKIAANVLHGCAIPTGAFHV